MFFSGKHTDVLRASIDSAEGDFAQDDTYVVVGALVFGGRQDEAMSLARTYDRMISQPSRTITETDTRSLAASRFFLLVGECRAGRYGAAEELARKNLAFYRSQDPRTRYFVQQGLGILRYFTGRIALAARHAAKARLFALDGRFSYGRMLALDLLGHSLTQTGQVHAGLAILEQAAELASAIGLAELAATTRSSIVAYRARFGVGAEDSVALLGRQLEQIGEADRYSRRLVLTELARIYAIRGEATLAFEKLERATEIALPDGDRRARVRLELSRAIAAGLREGEAAALSFVDSARRLIEKDNDPALDVEVIWTEYVVCPERFHNIDRVLLARLARDTGIARAAIMSNAAVGVPLDPREDLEDAYATLLANIRRPDGSLSALFSRHHLGLLPLALGLAPSRRVYVDTGRGTLSVESDGDVFTGELPGNTVVALLCAIASGAQTKENLIQKVWKLNVYRPEKHDAVVHTAISRLRNALGARGTWVRATDAGYALADGVSVAFIEGRNVRTITQEEMTMGEPDIGASLPPRKPHDTDRKEAILRLVGSNGAIATKEVAEELKISEMTAFRLLSAMTGSGLLARVGQGRGTRYRLAP